jgi:hypothetical protein
MAERGLLTEREREIIKGEVDVKKLPVSNYALVKQIVGDDSPN